MLVSPSKQFHSKQFLITKHLPFSHSLFFFLWIISKSICSSHFSLSVVIILIRSLSLLSYSYLSLSFCLHFWSSLSFFQSLCTSYSYVSLSLHWPQTYYFQSLSLCLCLCQPLWLPFCQSYFNLSVFLQFVCLSFFASIILITFGVCFYLSNIPLSLSVFIVDHFTLFLSLFLTPQCTGAPILVQLSKNRSAAGTSRTIIFVSLFDMKIPTLRHIRPHS